MLDQQQIIFISAALIPVGAFLIRLLAKGLGVIAHETLPPKVAETLTKQRGESQD